jgi:hypothetical protein
MGLICAEAVEITAVAMGNRVEASQKAFLEWAFHS